MRIAITGGTGFLGTAIVEELISQGHKPRDLVILARRPDPFLEALGVTSVATSILDGSALSRAIDGADILFHLAGRVSRKQSAAPALRRLHVDGTHLVLETAAAVGVQRVVYASTSGTVGCGTSPDFLAKDDDPDCMSVVSNWPYYATKLAAERVALRFHEKHGYPVMIMNPSLLLGPGDRRGSSTADVARFLAKKIPSVPRGGLNFVDVRDAAKVFVKAMSAGTPGKRNLIGGHNMTLADFFGHLSRLSGVPAPKFQLPVALELLGGTLIEKASKLLKLRAGIDRISAEMAQVFWYIESERARAELGHEPRPMDVTLTDTIEDVRRRG